MYACLCTCPDTCLHACLCTLSRHMSVCMSIRMSVCVSMHMSIYTCLHTYLYACLYTCVCAHLYTSLYASLLHNDRVRVLASGHGWMIHGMVQPCLALLYSYGLYIYGHWMVWACLALFPLDIHLHLGHKNALACRKPLVGVFFFSLTLCKSQQCAV